MKQITIILKQFKFVRTRTLYMVSAVLLLFSAVGAVFVSAPVHANPTFTEYSLPTPISQPHDLTLGPDGKIWYTTYSSSVHHVGNLDMSGNFTEYSTGTARLTGVTTGPDSNLWFSEGAAHKLAYMAPSGGPIHTQTLGSGNDPVALVTGPDGNLWYTASDNTINKRDSSGTITQYSSSIFGYGTLADDITVGPDGALWFTLEGPTTSNYIGRITTSGVITSYQLLSEARPAGIVSGPDGALWFTERGNGGKIGRITTSGSLTEYDIPTSNAEPWNLTVGSDGALWFVENSVSANKIGRITTSGVFSEYTIPTASSEPYDIVAGPDNAVWFTEGGTNKIGRLTTPLQ